MSVTAFWFAVTLYREQRERKRLISRKSDSIAFQASRTKNALEQCKRALVDDQLPMWPGYTSATLSAIARTGPEFENQATIERALLAVEENLQKITDLCGQLRAECLGIAQALHHNESRRNELSQDIMRTIPLAIHALDDLVRVLR